MSLSIIIDGLLLSPAYNYYWLIIIISDWYYYYYYM